MPTLDVLVRFALYLDLTLAFGVAFFALCAPQVRGALPLPGALASAGLAGIALSVLGLAVLSASMAGVPLSQVDAESVAAILTGMSLGKAWMVRIGGLALLIAAAAFLRSRPVAALSVASVGGALALGGLAWAGHGAMDEGAVGWLHLMADIAHLLAAGIWVGALTCLVLLVARPSHRADAAHLWATHRALDGFSLMGTTVVAVITATGLVNAWLLVGPTNAMSLPTTAYGQLLIAKLALFAAMLGFAAVNRYRLTPALAGRIDAGDHRGAIVALRVSVALETVCVVLVLALVAWLGILQPPASAM
ncbi:MAG: copper homeostasis membrane protein CopD [Sphingomonas sp.]|uniref:copper homeostasis membrane protein CopD n=1 Tax=Sphingomonas sp. TaxID=28214 RepID=UPI001AD3609C|nr:copper homeostasis membrane protein CopD [Sphingomonas sp.]MBN8809140.1 copper homeostasis membrane protein CopD [Sphingomonas sp.]